MKLLDSLAIKGWLAEKGEMINYNQEEFKNLLTTI
jgi:hypothetical protein